MTARHWFALVMGAALAVTLAFLVLPVVAIFTHTAPHKLITASVIPPRPTRCG